MEIMLQKVLLTWGMYFYFTLRSYYWGSLPHMSLKHRIFDPTVQIVIIFVFLTSRWLYRVLVSKDWLMTSQISWIGNVCVYIVNHKFPWIYSRFDSLVLPRENWSNWSLKQKKVMFLNSIGQLVILTTWSLIPTGINWCFSAGTKSHLSDRHSNQLRRGWKI